MSETENEKSTEETVEKKKGGKKKFVIIALVVILLAGSGGGFYYWRTVVAANNAVAAEPDKKSKKAQKKEADEASKNSPADKKASDPLSNALPDDEDVKKIVELQPFIVNLADTEQARYLRMTVSLGVDGEETKEKPDQIFITRVRNAMLAVLSDKKSDEILTVEGKAKLRVELLKAAQAASDDPEVKAIYITDFIVQL